MINEQTHTPGPWKVAGVPWEYNTYPRVWTHRVHTSTPGIGHEARGFSEAEVIANAELIARAPDTAAELARVQALNKELVEALEGLTRLCSNAYTRREYGTTDWLKLKTRIAAARAALAKVSA